MGFWSLVLLRNFVQHISELVLPLTLRGENKEIFTMNRILSFIGRDLHLVVDSLALIAS